jgi:hypothetical protein
MQSKQRNGRIYHFTFLVITTYLLAYIPPAYFFFHLIKWAMSQYRFIVTRLGGHWYYARVKVGWTGQHVIMLVFGSCIDLLYKREQYLVDTSSFVFWLLSWNSSASFSFTMKFAVVRLTFSYPFKFKL